MSAFDRFKSAHKQGEYIFHDGDSGVDMFIVQSGAVDSVKEVHGEEAVIATLEKGDFFGEMAVLENLPRNVGARVREDAEVISINGTTFDKMLKSNIEIAVRMLRKFSARARDADEEVIRLTLQLRQGGGAPLDAEPLGPAGEVPAAAPVPAQPTAAQPRPVAPAPQPTVAQQPPAAAAPAPAVAQPAAAAPAPQPTVAQQPPAAAAAPAPAVAQPAVPAPAAPAVAAAGTAADRPILVVKGSDKTYLLTADDVTIGRADPVTGLRPDIDLTNEDVNRFISRRHARILHKDGTYYLVEEVGVTNGTYLNGKRLQAGVYSPIRVGDELCFGKVFLMFEAPKA